MEYRSGRVGRVFIIRFDHGDDPLAGLKELARKEKVRCCFFQLLGGLRQADVVTGPREPTVPPEPVWEKIRDARETLAAGSLFWDGDEPRLHLHAALGHHGQTLTACLRENARVYLVLEAYLFEVTEIDAGRPWFPEGGFHRLAFGHGGGATES